MAENEIIAEIHRHREAVARECDYDAAKIMAYYRRREAERPNDDGHRLISPAKPEPDSCVVREEPPEH